ncbi:uncharacterized protein LOC115474957 isoform X3 [Microcaecilia unicolor]|uniref:Uncharacterized protein LOC115474957 isoform X3 n=1 Tax=Microcaecilia unicolor TaxID=1415580 RepID=A0A6P7YTK6_9AMPH|nr:uncharacterized protein LOC115474957 isoform X3 [Microcaecilia unicolor]
MKTAGDRTHGLKGRRRSNQQPTSQKQEPTLKSKSRQRKRPGQSPTACSARCSVVEAGTETGIEPSKELNERKVVSPVRESGTRSEKYVGAHLSIQDVFEKSQNMLVEELECCRQLGLTLYNMHPGAGIDATSVNECLNRIADGINYAHGCVDGVTVVLENMSCQGTTIGGKFEELRGIIDRVQDKSRIGVCLDTCHAFAAGYDLSKKEGLQKMLDEFNSVVGLHYLKAVHLNDSKGALGCHLDRHENIGRGHIGLEGFRHIMNEPHFNDIPMILETPYSPIHGDPREEIELLYTFCKGEGDT